MKILFLIDNLCGGGAEKVLTDILNNINKEKYEIDLFLIRNKGVYLNDIPKNIGINYIYNDYKYEKNSMIYKIYYLMTKIHFKINRILGLKRLFRRKIIKNYDVYIPFLEGACFQLISDSNITDRKIAWIHTDLKKHEIMNKNKELEALSNMDKIICVSAASKESILEKYPSLSEKVEVITNPIDINAIERKSKEELSSYDDELFSSKDPVFVSVGRLEKVKGYDLLIEAHKLLLNENINHKIFVLGDGSEKEILQNKIKEYSLEKTFKLMGFKSNPYKYVNKADYYIMPSRYEGYPLSLCEAIALGKPIISTNFPSSYEILKNGQLGLIAEIENVNDIKEKMKQIILNDSLKEKLKKTCLNYKNQFSFDNKIKDIENLIEDKA